jgi:hypothetical protein
LEDFPHLLRRSALKSQVSDLKCILAIDVPQCVTHSRGSSRAQAQFADTQPDQ